MKYEESMEMLNVYFFYVVIFNDSGGLDHIKNMIRMERIQKYFVSMINFFLVWKCWKC